MNPVILQAQPPPSPLRTARCTSAPLTCREVGYGYRPGWSLGLSIICHQLVFIAILVSSGRQGLVQLPRIAKTLSQPGLRVATLYLAPLGGGSQGSGQPGGGSGSAGKVSTGLRARSRRGFAYPGRQPMVSSPPRASIGLQTILQPALKNPRQLRRYLLLPNIVRPPAAEEAGPAQPVISVKPGGLSLRPLADQPIEPPKIKLPAAAAPKIPSLAMPEPRLPAKPATLTTVPYVAEIPSAPRRDQEGLLVLNAVPPPPDVMTKVPPVEARGLFADSPAYVTVIADPASGAKEGGPLSMAAGSGDRADIPSGDAIAETARGGKENSRGPGGSGVGSGGRYGSGKGSGLNAAVEGSGSGRGAGRGAGTGVPSGTTLGSGTGVGSAPGRGAFPGITIQGGQYTHGAASNLHAGVVPLRPGSYGMTIVSTASSGGGLPDFGVFQNEKVYTVYLDMRALDEDPAPSWTLQYSVMQRPAGDPGTSSSNRIPGTPTPPYAMFKEIPRLTPELTRKCAHKLIVASAILNSLGRLEQVSVRQSPDSELIGPLVEALNNWAFLPSQIDGKPVSLKMLFGIRLAPSN